MCLFFMYILLFLDASKSNLQEILRYRDKRLQEGQCMHTYIQVLTVQLDFNFTLTCTTLLNFTLIFVKNLQPGHVLS